MMQFIQIRSKTGTIIGDGPLVTLATRAVMDGDGEYYFTAVIVVLAKQQSAENNV